MKFQSFNYRALLSLLLVAILLGYATSPGSDRKKLAASSTGDPTHSWKSFDANSINCTISNSGPYADYLRTNSSGLEWPKGSGRTAVFTAGIWVIGKHRPTGNLRTAVQDYQTEFQPGPIVRTFNTTTNDSSAAADPTDPRFHVYKIERKDSVGGVNPDYDQWPGDLGAPYIDVNGNGRWDSGIDRPKLWGDQQLWCVYNDTKNSAHVKTGTTPPLGIEVQGTYFGFTGTGVLGSWMFIRWKIINRSDADYDSTFISMWSDTDLGGANDDYSGFDIQRTLAYTYDETNNDYMYGSSPPADGFVLFEGPRIEHPDSTAWFEGERIKGYYNNRSTSHAVYFGGDPRYSDPPLANPTFPAWAYGYQCGLIGGTGSPFIDPTNGEPTKFVMSGDPVTDSGWTMHKSHPRGTDVRSMISSGPFTLASGDTQEIVGAFIIADGGERLKSVTLLRKFCDAAQNAFNSNFRVPTANVATSISGTDAQLKIVADGSAADAVSIEGTLANAAGAPIASITLYDDGTHGDGAAGDKIFANTLVLTPQPEGMFLDLTVTDTKSQKTFWPSTVQGITTTSLRVTKPVVFSDNLNGDGIANNGENVRFGFSVSNTSPFEFLNIEVTSLKEAHFKTISIPAVGAGEAINLAYNPSDPNTYLSFNVPASYTDSAFRISLTLADDNCNVWEDSIIFRVEPFQQRIAVLEHIRGSAYGSPTIGIAAPNLVKDHMYVITGVDSVDAGRNSGISIKDSTDGRILLENAPLPDWLAQTDSPVLDGFKVFRGNVRSALYASARSLTPDSLRWFTGASFQSGFILDGSTYLGKDFSASPFRPSFMSKGDYRTVEMRFSPKKSYQDKNSNGRYDVGEPYAVDSINTSAAQKAYFYTKQISSPSQFSGFYWVPFAVYDVDVSPPRQLSAVVLDNEMNHQWDIETVTGTQYKNYVWILPDSYDPSGTSFDPAQGGRDFGNLALNGLASFYYGIWCRQLSPAPEPYSTNYAVSFIPSHPLSSSDAYLFNPTVYTGVVGDHTSIPLDFSLDQNFPNPFNPSTTIGYELPSVQKVILKVFNVLGQEVSTLVNEPQGAGKYRVTFDASRLATGVYFYGLQAGRFVETKKMIVMK